MGTGYSHAYANTCMHEAGDEAALRAATREAATSGGGEKGKNTTASLHALHWLCEIWLGFFLVQ